MPLVPVEQTRRRAEPYFGRTEGSPPGLPGGGITGILLPPSGVGARISGSTPAGGHSVPSDFASLSPKASLDWPTVAPSFMVPVPDPRGAIGAQLAGGVAAGGAVCAGGVAGEAGACAFAAPEISSAEVAIIMGFIRMR